jgi:hypothetical protein
MKGFLLLVQTCDNSMELGVGYMEGVGEVNCLSASKVTAAECRHAILWSKRICFDSKRLVLQLTVAQWCSFKVVLPYLKNICKQTQHNTN